MGVFIGFEQVGIVEIISFDDLNGGFMRFDLVIVFLRRRKKSQSLVKSLT